MSATEYKQAVNTLSTLNDMTDETKVYRYLLKEKANNNPQFIPNTEVKILDLINIPAGKGLVLFNDLTEADAFYKAIAPTATWSLDYPNATVPKAKFTNQLKSMPELPTTDNPPLIVTPSPSEPELDLLSKPNRPNKPQVAKTGELRQKASLSLIIFSILALTIKKWITSKNN